MKTKTEYQKKLNIAKLNWREEMRRFWGLTWTKRSASKHNKDGEIRMNKKSKFLINERL